MRMREEAKMKSDRVSGVSGCREYGPIKWIFILKWTRFMHLICKLIIRIVLFERGFGVVVHRALCYCVPARPLRLMMILENKYALIGGVCARCACVLASKRDSRTRNTPSAQMNLELEMKKPEMPLATAGCRGISLGMMNWRRNACRVHLNDLTFPFNLLK